MSDDAWLSEYDARARARHAADNNIDEGNGYEEDKLLLDAIATSDTWLVARIYREGLDSFEGPFVAARFEDEGMHVTILNSGNLLLVVTRDDDEDLVRRHVVEHEGISNEGLMHLAQRAADAHWREEITLG